jgi:hypothetical protein
MPSLTAEVVKVTVWKLESGPVNDYAPLVFASDKDVESGMFDTSGASLSWSKGPRSKSSSNRERRNPNRWQTSAR